MRPLQNQAFLKLVFCLLALNTTLSWAGGPKCAPGYCLDNDGNGCHPCNLYPKSFDLEKLNGENGPNPLTPDGVSAGAICCSDVGGPNPKNCVKTC